MATPLWWEELEDGKTTANRWTITSVPGRIDRDGDPWGEMGRKRQTLTVARRRLEQALAEARAPSA